MTLDSLLLQLLLLDISLDPHLLLPQLLLLQLLLQHQQQLLLQLLLLLPLVLSLIATTYYWLAIHMNVLRVLPGVELSKWNQRGFLILILTKVQCVMILNDWPLNRLKLILGFSEGNLNFYGKMTQVEKSKSYLLSATWRTNYRNLHIIVIKLFTF